MKEKIIEKKKVNKLLSTLSESYLIFVPGEENDVSQLCKFSPDREIPWDYSNTLIPPKDIFFPQNETLYEYKGQKVTESGFKVPSTIIFGIRPCDVHAFSMMDKVFDSEDFQDPYYLERRKATTVVSLSCTNPGITCFCTCLNEGPDSDTGADVILFDIGEKILARTITEKGEKLLNTYEKSFAAAQKEDSDKRDDLVKSAREKIQAQVNIVNLKEKLDQAFDADFWDTLHMKCLGCAMCTYLCPTCHCFDITDETERDMGRRIRCWDSCQFPLFTLHTSGHNPRSTYKERMRQRIMHKFNYCPENFNETFCVGCGRCIVNCPVNLDIREVIKEING
ncbi:4Fe-4S dicluster domain-containing protein [Candidatus Latescibacterota bacterium]